MSGQTKAQRTLVVFFIHLSAYLAACTRPTAGYRPHKVLIPKVL